MTSPIPGALDDDSNPVWNPWYLPGWTAQNQKNVLAPPNNFLTTTALPSWITKVEVIGNYIDGVGNPLGGYFTFQQSEELLITDTTVSPTAFYQMPKRHVGDIPVTNAFAWNEEGSGKIHLIHGKLDVLLIPTDVAHTTIMATSSDTDSPTSWVYHVKEFFMGGYKYDIAVPSGTTPVDIHSLVVPGTIKHNHDWNRGY